MEKVEYEAKQAGIEIPHILTDLDEKTGMPKILNIKVSVRSLGSSEKRSSHSPSLSCETYIAD